MNNLQKKQIVQLRSRGESYAKIAAFLNIPENTIKSYCRRNNLGTNFISSQLPETASTCVNCGSPLDHNPGSKKKRFCSDKCRMVWWNAHPKAVNRKAVYQFVCPVCEKAFESYGNANRKYCSRACHASARRASHV